eukprot:GHVP01067007.1.p2 GENE.GHVP01067007.1~~GHVP01067007.1.p2  ORF type:complete len:205 (+),score=32.00 GHVP01067007.1:1524-2138(+)
MSFGARRYFYILRKGACFNIEDYAGNILPKLKINEDIKVHSLDLDVSAYEQVKNIINREDNSIFVSEQLYNLALTNYAVWILQKLILLEDPELCSFVLDVKLEENIKEILELKPRHLFKKKKTGKLKLSGYAVFLLSILAVDRLIRLRELELDSSEENQILSLLALENETILIEKAEKITLSNYAVSLLPKYNLASIMKLAVLN